MEDMLEKTPMSLPGQKDSLILLQLLHEGRVGLGDGAPLLHVIKGGVQVPAVLLHSVGDHRGGGAAHAHLTVNQTLGSGFPEAETGLERPAGGVGTSRRAADPYLALVMNL